MRMNRLTRITLFAIALGMLSSCADNLVLPPGETETERAARSIKNFARSEVVSAGLVHSCARSHEAAYCWGDNGFGVLGVGPDVSGSPVPLPVAFPTDPFLADYVVHTVFAGTTHSCAVRSTLSGLERRQQLYCWGENNSGQLGDGTRSKRFQPVEVLGDTGAPLEGILKVGGGLGHGCAMQGDLTLPRDIGGDAPTALYCWGSNDNGQVTGSARQTPSDVVEIPFLPSITDFAVGFNHTCAVTGEGNVICWGRNPATGELFDESVPIEGLTDVTGITAGLAHTCALTRFDGAFCWGANGSGQLGDGTTTASDMPRPVPGDFVELSAGAEFTCGRLLGGVQCWGSNGSGQLGDGLRRQSSIPVDVADLQAIVSDVSAGAAHTCVKANKTVSEGASGLRCWGRGVHGQLGDGAFALTNVPFDPAQNPDIALAALAELDAGKGAPANQPGQRPSGPFEQSLSWANPVPVVGFAQNLSDIDAGRNHTCLLGNRGVPYCWGGNRDGEIGNDAPGMHQFTPVTPIGLEGGVISIAAGGTFAVGAGGGFTCAVDGDGGLHCWGDNSFRQFADGTMIDRPVPQAVAGLSGAAVKVAASTYNTCVLIEDGTVDCLTEDIPRETPAVPGTVVGLDSVVDIAVGEFHLCALDASGRVECIGNSSTGAIGCAGGQLEPCEVTAIPDAVAVAAGPFTSCALTGDGGVWCWGDNPGDGQCNNSNNVPVQPVGLEMGVTSLALGPLHSCAVKGESGALYCWGRNPSGALGFEPENTCFSQPKAIVPTLVPGFESGVLGAATGADHTCVIVDDRLQCFGSNVEGQLAAETTTRKGMTGEIGPLVKLVEQLVSILLGPEFEANVAFVELPPPGQILTIPEEDLFSRLPDTDTLSFLVHDPEGVLLPLDDVGASVDKGGAGSPAPNRTKVALDENGGLTLRPSGAAGAVIVDVVGYYVQSPVGDQDFGADRSAASTTRISFGAGVDLSLKQDRRVDGISVDIFDGIGTDRILDVTSFLTKAGGKGDPEQMETDLRYKATNEGPIDVSGARFTAAVDMPAGGPTTTWTCSVPVGACSPASGDGDIDTRFDLAVGDAALIRVTGTGPASAGFLDVRASLEPPPGVPAFLSDDDTAVTVVPLSQEGLFRSGFE